MLRHVAVLVTLGLLVAGCPAKSSCPQGATTPGAAGQDEITTVEHQVEAWRKAYESRTSADVFALYDHGTSVSVVTQGVAVVGWDAVETDLIEKLGRSKEIHLRLGDVRVAPMPSGAVAVAALSREISDGVTSVSDAGTLTLTFGKVGDRWLIVAEHFSFRPR